MLFPFVTSETTVRNGFDCGGPRRGRGLPEAPARQGRHREREQKEALLSNREVRMENAMNKSEYEVVWNRGLGALDATADEGGAMPAKRRSAHRPAKSKAALAVLTAVMLSAGYAHADNLAVGGTNVSSATGSTPATSNNTGTSGNGATAGSDSTAFNTAVGNNTNAAGGGATALGDNAQANGIAATSLGSGTAATGANTTVVGAGAQATSAGATAFGAGAAAKGVNTIAIGNGSAATGVGAIAPPAPPWRLRSGQTRGQRQRRRRLPRPLRSA